MAPRIGKRTTCQQCGSRGQFGFLEILWRWNGRGAWSWIKRELCAACRGALLDFIGRGVVVADPTATPGPRRPEPAAVTHSHEAAVAVWVAGQLVATNAEQLEELKARVERS